MLKTVISFCCVLPVLPCFGQTSEVVVRSAEVVQVSNGEQSPNITEVGTATVYYITCYNVIYCGPSGTSSGPNIYSFAAASFAAAATPVWPSSVIPVSQDLPSEITSASFASLRTASWTYNSDSSGANGQPGIALPLVTGTTIGGSPQAVEGLPTSSDLGKYSGLMNALGITPPSNMGLSASFLDSDSANASTVLTAQETTSGEQGGLPAASDPLHCFQSQNGTIGGCGLLPAIASAPKLIGLDLDSTESGQLGVRSPQPDSVAWDSSLVEKLLASSHATVDVSAGSELAKFSVSTGSKPTFTLASMDQPRLVGAIPQGEVAVSPYNDSGVGDFGNLGAIGVLSSFRSSSGADVGSLSRELNDLTEHGAKILTWSILYEPASAPSEVR
jgi:hypothetical protein